MNSVTFSVWKFKTVEGHIECNGYDFNTTKIKGSDGQTYFVQYIYEKEVCKIIDTKMNVIRECTFKDIVKNLKELNLWRELEVKHSSVTNVQEGI